MNHTSENLATVVVTTVKTPTEIKNVTSTNNTSPILNIRLLKDHPEGKRRAVLIINSPSVLRQNNGKSNGKKNGKNGSKDKSGVQSLLYVEYSEDGAVLAEFMMNNMEDVSKFFEQFLHTELCHGSC